MWKLAHKHRGQAVPPCALWKLRTRKAGDVIQTQSEGLRTRGADDIVSSLGVNAGVTVVIE